MKVLLLMFFPVYVFGQVVNDSISMRKTISKGQTILSNTTNCTVEWKCVDESLTGKCIDYHNDQWFSFYSKSDEKLFINISGQRCRDLYGVQLVVTEGIPCEVSTYNILACVSLATQDDFYIGVDFKKDKEYLLNIDGYLHDNCKFLISVDSIAKGFPTYQNLPLKIKGKKTYQSVRLESKDKRDYVSFGWVLPDSLNYQIALFEIYKRSNEDVKFQLLDSIPVKHNAYGDTQSKYVYADTLKGYRRYYYKIIAVNKKDKKMLVKDFSF